MNYDSLLLCVRKKPPHKRILVAWCCVSETAGTSSPLTPVGLKEAVFSPLGVKALGRRQGDKTGIEKFPNLSERSIKVPMH